MAHHKIQNFNNAISDFVLDKDELSENTEMDWTDDGKPIERVCQGGHLFSLIGLHKVLCRLGYRKSNRISEGKLSASIRWRWRGNNGGQTTELTTVRIGWSGLLCNLQSLDNFVHSALFQSTQRYNWVPRQRLR